MEREIKINKKLLEETIGCLLELCNEKFQQLEKTILPADNQNSKEVAMVANELGKVARCISFITGVEANCDLV